MLLLLFYYCFSFAIERPEFFNIFWILTPHWLYYAWFTFLTLMVFNPVCVDIICLSKTASSKTGVTHQHANQYMHTLCKIEGTHIKAGRGRIIVKTTVAPLIVDKGIHPTKFMLKYKLSLCMKMNYYRQPDGSVGKGTCHKTLVTFGLTLSQLSNISCA